MEYENEEYEDEEDEEEMDEALREWAKEIIDAVIPKIRITIIDPVMLRAVEKKICDILDFIRKSCVNQKCLPEVYVDFWKPVTTSMYAKFIISNAGITFKMNDLAEAIKNCPEDCLVEIYPRIDESFSILITFRDVQKLIAATPTKIPPWLEDLFDDE